MITALIYTVAALIIYAVVGAVLIVLLAMFVDWRASRRGVQR